MRGLVHALDHLLARQPGDSFFSTARVRGLSEWRGSHLFLRSLQVGFKTQPGNRRELSLEETVELVKDAITCACERDIYTGDEADIWIITQAGTQKTRFSLKRD